MASKRNGKAPNGQKKAATALPLFAVEMRPIASVIPYARNPRKNEAAVAKVAASIREFGFRQPIVVDPAMTVIVGHTRLLAARQLDLKSVPVHVARGLSPAQVKAYRLADNRVAQESEWDMELLALELGDLRGLDFDLALTGFDAPEIAALGASGLLEGTDPDEVPEPPVEPTSREGDLILLGRHRLLCGDATNPQHVDALLDGASPQMVYTDPPYGIEIVSPDGKIGKSSGHRSIKGDDSTQSAIDAYNLVATLGIPTLVFWGANYYAEALPPSSCWIVWDKQNDGMTFANAELAWTNQETAVRLFRHEWNGPHRASERGEKRVHPTQKPVALAEWCFGKYGQSGDVVLDLFAGSGTTVIAAEKSARTALLMELDPAYCDVIVTRWEKATGQKATR